MEKKRSIGVTIFAWFYIVSSLLGIFSVLTLKDRLAIYQETHLVSLPNSYYYVAQSYGVISLIAGLIIGIGLLRLLKWARLLPIVMAVVGFIYVIMLNLIYIRPHVIPNFIKNNKPTSVFYVGPILGILWVLIVIYFFTRPKVKEQFR